MGERGVKPCPLQARLYLPLETEGLSAYCRTRHRAVTATWTVGPPWSCGGDGDVEGWSFSYFLLLMAWGFMIRGDYFSGRLYFGPGGRG